MTLAGRGRATAAPLFAVVLAVAFAVAAQAQEAVTFATPARDHPVAAIEGRVYRPGGEGPFPGVVLLHGCNGPSSNVSEWGALLAARGYVALEVTGFRARGVEEVCTRTAGSAGITLRDRAGDAHGGLAWLRAQAGVDPGRIAVMGFSHGASTALLAASLGFPRPEPGSPDFAAAVAMYPGCFDFDLDTSMPLLLVTGEADDWTPSRPCERKAARARESGYDVAVAVMPGAHHAFDARNLPLRWLPTVRNGSRPGGCCGATIAGDTAARERAEREVLEFLHSKLARARAQAGVVSRPPVVGDRVVEASVRAAAGLAPAEMIAAVNEHGGRFEGNRFHVGVIDESGRYLAHARYPSFIGQPISARDDEGRPLLERLREAADGGGWGGYRLRGTEVRVYAQRAGDRLVAGVRY